MTFSFLHAADIHLDSPLKGLESYPDAPVEQIRNATRRALNNLVDLAIDEEVAFVLLVGDIFDGAWRDFNTALFFAQRMGRLREAGIRVFLVTGNHDAASPIVSNLKPPDNVYILSSKSPETIHVEDLGVSIHGQGYSKREIQDDMAANYPMGSSDLFDIGLLHTSLTGRPRHEPYAPTNTDVLASRGYDYWALGHVHTREIVGREPWIVFPGCIQGRHINEEGAKGCSVVHVEDIQVKEVIHHDLDVLRWQLYRVDLEECDHEEHIWIAVRRALESAIDAGDGRPVAIRLEFVGRTYMHNWLHEQQEQVQEECRVIASGLGDIWLERIRMNTQPLTQIREEMDPDSPLASLLQSIKGLTLSPSCQEHIPELADMLSKLPPEIKSGEEPFDLNDPSLLGQMQEEVKELLFSRMLRQGGRS